MSDISTKPRTDAWDAALTEAQRWEVYDRLRRGRWYEVAAWAQQEYGLEGAPARGSIYRFAARMRAQESAHRIEQAIQARDEIGALAGTAATGDRLIAAYQSMAAELALNGNAADAVRLTTMAMQLAAQQIAAAELKIKTDALELRAREVAVKESYSRDLAVDLLLKEAGANEQAKALLRQFLAALDGGAS